MSGPQDSPLISLCIPTHSGRAGTLSELLEGIIAQARELPPGMVEVCVSDNASADHTAEVVADITSRASCPIRYRRLERDLGLTANLLSAVELATGEYCWLMGSDDILEEGALGRLLELIDSLPGLTGYVVGAIYVDGDDPGRRSRQLPRAFHPLGSDTRRLDGVDSIYDECGNSWIVLSWNIVARDAWNTAVESHRDRAFANPLYPQVVLLAAMARESPRWGWLAEPLVRQRNAPVFLFQSGENLADRWSQIVGTVSAVWADILGGRLNRRWRTRMRAIAGVWATAQDVRATKLFDRPSIRSQLHLAGALLRAFWPVRSYWRETMAASLMPVWLTRARHGPGGGLLASRAKLTAGQLVLSGALPRHLPAGGVQSIGVVVRNAGPGRLPVTGPDAVAIAQRWWSSEGTPLDWATFGTNELAGMSQTLSRPVGRGRSVSTEMSLYAPLQPGSYRLEIVANQPGRWLDEAGVAAALSGEVEVSPRPSAAGSER